MKKTMVSVTFGRLWMLHFGFGRELRFTTQACFKGLAHYRKWKTPSGKSMRSFRGDLIHFDNGGKCVGYSRRLPWGRMLHYDSRGNKIGYTRWILWLLAIHHIA